MHIVRFIKDLYYSRYKLHTIQWYEGVTIKSYWKLNRIVIEKGLLRVPIRYVRDDVKQTVYILLEAYRKAKAKTLIKVVLLLWSATL